MAKKILGTLKLHADKAAPKPERDGVKFGKSTGLRLTHYLCELIFANKTAHASDDDLQTTLASEFPGRAARQAISAYRAYYNGGKHGFGENGAAPKVAAEQYARATEIGKAAMQRDTSHPLAGRTGTGGKKKTPKTKVTKPKGKTPKPKTAKKKTTNA